MSKCIFTVVNDEWVDILNVFTEAWIRDKPKNVDYILYHDGTVDYATLNHKPDVFKEINPELLKHLNYILNNRDEKITIEGLKGFNLSIMAARIFALEELKTEYDYSLYLDADVIVRDLSSLLSLKPTASIAAVECEFSLEAIALIKHYMKIDLKARLRYAERHYYSPHGYINAGVMMFNNNKINYKLPFNISKLFIHCVSSLKFLDQDFINMLFAYDIEYLDRSYNFCCPPILYDSENKVIPYPKEIIDYYLEALDDSKVIHYIAGWRPWHPITCIKKADIFPFAKVVPHWLDVFKKTPSLRSFFVDKINQTSDYFK
jgi:lipopolysaccharide biosynthesis glycosyltransferase